MELAFYYNTLSYTEKVAHMETVGHRLLEHRYRYYILDAPILADWVYDYIERYYECVAQDMGLPAIASNMVDFDLSRVDAQEAKARVDKGNAERNN